GNCSRILAICLFWFAARQDSYWPSNEIYLTQEADHIYTLCSNAMILRTRKHLSHNDYWQKITEEELGKSTWYDGMTSGYTFSIATSRISVS
ncbi:MAG: hypothetical protein HUJ51_00795, partial [Eggerthellaceae bacterium]|nr:hypothetical protein [Eggerthellaceae bacterium]